jgi:hypothetical protein
MAGSLAGILMMMIRLNQLELLDIVKVWVTLKAGGGFKLRA